MKNNRRTVLCRVVSALLIIALLSTISVFAGSVTEGTLEERSTAPRSLLSISVASEAALEYTRNREGNLLGVDDFYVDGDTVSILSSSSNEVLQYRNNVLQCRICLDDFGIYGTNIASKGDMLFVLDGMMNMNTFINNRIVSTIDMFERCRSEAVESFYIVDDVLLLCVNDIYRLDFMTYMVSVSPDGSLCYKNAVNGQPAKKSEEVSESDIEAFRTEIKKDARIAVSSMRNGLATHMLTGVSAYFLGEMDADTVVMRGREGLKDAEGLHYSCGKLYILNRNDGVERELLLPIQNKYIHEQTKMIDHRLYFLNAQVDTVSVLDLTDCEQFGTVMDSIEISTETNYTEQEKQERIAAIQPRYAVTRDTALSTARSYYTHYWTCSASNLASLSGWEMPSYLNGAGTYRSVPYCWGGFDTLDSFDAGLLNGDRAGNTSKTYLTNTRGVDCSGLVSRCWNLSSKHSTGTLPSVCTSMTFDPAEGFEPEPADAFINSNHARLFYYKNTDGTYAMFECTTTGNKDRVIVETYTADELKRDGYKLYSYNNIFD